MKTPRKMYAARRGRNRALAALQGKAQGKWEYRAMEVTP